MKDEGMGEEGRGISRRGCNDYLSGEEMKLTSTTYKINF
jgi:hypothetical protein